MTTRKMTQAEEMELVKNNLNLNYFFLDKIQKEAHELQTKGKLTRKEEKRVDELLEQMKDIGKAVRRDLADLKAFYRPAMK